MAKGDDGKSNQVTQAQNLQTNQVNNLQPKFDTQYNDAYAQDQALRQQITNNFTNFNPDFSSILNPDGTLINPISSGGAGGSGMSITGGINPNDISGMGAEAYAGYRKLAQGLGQNFWNDYNNYANSLNSAIGQYQNFANTGGFSQADKDAMMAQAIAPSRQIYQNAQDQARLDASRMGVNSGGNGAALNALARNQNQSISDANVNALAQQAQLVQQGKEFGTSGLSQASLAGMDARTQVEQLNAQMKEAGLGGMTDIEKARLTAQLQNQQIQQSADIASAQLAESAAGRAESASSANAALQERALTDQYGLQLQNNQQGISLYGTTPAATALADQTLLGNQQLSNNFQLGVLGSYGNNGNNTSIPQKVGQYGQAASQIGAGVGAIGNIFGAGAAATPAAAMGLNTISMAAPTSALAGSGSALGGSSALGALGTAGTIGAEFAFPLLAGHLVNPGPLVTPNLTSDQAKAAAQNYFGADYASRYPTDFDWSSVAPGQIPGTY